MSIFKSLKEINSYKAFGIASAGVTIILALFNPILSKYVDSYLVIMSFYVVCFLFLLIVAFIAISKVKIKPLIKDVFQGAGEILDEEKIWTRYKLTQELTSKINDSDKMPVIVVGTSGTGKSVLLKNLVKPELERNNWKFEIIKRYDNIQSKICEKLKSTFHDMCTDEFRRNAIISKIHPEQQAVIVFDQFEQFISKHPADKDKEWFKTFIANNVIHDNLRIVIVIRKEWYYDLRFLSTFIPTPYKAFHLPGITPEDEELIDIKDKFDKFTTDRETTDFIVNSLFRNGEILLVEVQIVGLMIENEYKNNHGDISTDYFEQDLNGKEGLIQKYFKYYIDSSPDKNITLKVMFALSVKTELRRDQYKPSLIAKIIFEDQDDVTSCLQYLTKKGLATATQTAAGEFELAHDYLAEKYHELSGVELAPIDRDNIIFYWDEIKRIPDINELDIKTKQTSKIVISDIIQFIVLFAFIAKLFSPLLGISWIDRNPISDMFSKQKIIDLYFLPVFITHLAWSFYVNLTYRRFLSVIKESIVSRLFSLLMIFGGVILNFFAIFMTHYWIAFVGVGGMLVGIKYIQYSIYFKSSRLTQTFFRSFGIKALCIVTLFFISGIGTAYYINSFFTVQNIVLNYYYISVFLGIVLTFFMISLVPENISRNGVSRLIGICNRDIVRNIRIKQIKKIA